MLHCRERENVSPAATKSHESCLKATTFSDGLENACGSLRTEWKARMRKSMNRRLQEPAVIGFLTGGIRTCTRPSLTQTGPGCKF